jgi:hypothetical protein
MKSLISSTETISATGNTNRSRRGSLKILAVIAMLGFATLSFAQSGMPDCDAGKLSDYEKLGATGCLIGDKKFSNFQYHQGPAGLSSDAISLTPGTTGETNDPGLLFEGKSSSFTLTAPMSDIVSIHFFTWHLVEDHLSTVDSVIGTSPFLSGLFLSDRSGGFHTASVTDTPLFIDETCCQISKDSLTFSSIDLPAGTSPLTLDNAVAGEPFGPHGAMWDQNSGGLSTAYDDPALGAIPSKASYIHGTTTPEPSSILLFGSGILGLAGVLRRRLMGQPIFCPTSDLPGQSQCAPEKV